MPAIDQCEPQVVRALQKAGWVVTHQPFPIRVSRSEGVFADLRLTYEDQQIIVVEVKCFSDNRSQLDEFYRAVGQYTVYRSALRLMNITAKLYLTVPIDVYTHFFTRKMIAAAVRDSDVKLVIVDLDQEEVVRWTD